MPPVNDSPVTPNPCWCPATKPPELVEDASTPDCVRRFYRCPDCLRHNDEFTTEQRDAAVAWNEINPPFCRVGSKVTWYAAEEYRQDYFGDLGWQEYADFKEGDLEAAIKVAKEFESSNDRLVKITVEIIHQGPLKS